MKGITADATFEQATFPISSANISTAVTGLASVVAIDQDYAFSKHLSLILNEAEELSGTPTSDKASGLLAYSAFPFHTSSSQNFKGDSIAITVNNCFANTVVGISDEPSLSTSHSVQMPFGGTSACSLKTTLQMLASPFDFTKLPAIEENIITSDCGIVNSPINSYYFADLSGTRSINLGYNVQKDSALLEADSCRVRHIERISLKIRWNLDIVFFPPADGAYPDSFRVGVELESVVIEPYRRKPFLGGFLFKLKPFKHIASLVSDGSHEAAVEFRISLPDCLVSEVVEPGFVESLGFHSSINSVLAGLISQAYRASQIIVSNDFSFDCNLHSGLLENNWYLNPARAFVQCPVELLANIFKQLTNKKWNHNRTNHPDSLLCYKRRVPLTQ